MPLKLTIRIIERGGMVGIKLVLEKFWKINNVFNLSNDIKDFCWLDLICSVMLCFTIFC